jgi:hypothetical protein
MVGFAAPLAWELMIVCFALGGLGLTATKMVPT